MGDPEKEAREEEHEQEASGSMGVEIVGAKTSASPRRTELLPNPGESCAL